MSQGWHKGTGKALPNPQPGDERNYVTIGENERYIYSLCREGVLLRTRKSNMSEKAAKVFLKHDRACVNMGGKTHKLSTLVAKHFVKGWVPDSIIEHRDGNIRNCHADNLRIMPRKGFKAKTYKQGRNRPIYANGVRYETVTAYAKGAHVSRGTVYNALKNRHQRSVLEGVEFEFENLENEGGRQA